MTGKRFLNWKYGNEPVPPEVLPKTLEDCAKEAELVKKAKAGLLVEKPKKEVPPKGDGARQFNVFVDGDYFSVEVEAIGGAPMITGITPMACCRSEAGSCGRSQACCSSRGSPQPHPKPAAPIEGGTKLESPCRVWS